MFDHLREMFGLAFYGLLAIGCLLGALAAFAAVWVVLYLVK